MLCYHRDPKLMHLVLLCLVWYSCRSRVCRPVNCPFRSERRLFRNKVIDKVVPMQAAREAGMDCQTHVQSHYQPASLLTACSAREE